MSDYEELETRKLSVNQPVRSVSWLSEPSTAGYRELAHAAVSDHHVFARLSTFGADCLNLLDDGHVEHLAEYHVFAIQPSRLRRAEEELRAVGVGAGVGHGEDSLAGVLEREVLVGELLAVDALAARAVTAREVAALAHEAGDDAVELAALEAEALLARAERAEVLRRLGDDVAAELHGDAASRRAADGHIKEDLRFRHYNVIYAAGLCWNLPNRFKIKYSK